MSRLALSLVGILAVAGCAGTPTRTLQLHATDQAAFEASVASFKQELPSYKWQLFAIALGSIWETTKAQAAPTRSEADTTEAYFARVDGLTYREIVDLADATSPTTRQKYWAAHANGPAFVPAPWSAQAPANGRSARPSISSGTILPTAFLIIFTPHRLPSSV